VVRPNELRAAFHRPARRQIREADHPPADAVARLDDGDVRARLRQLVGGRQSRVARADHDDTGSRALTGEASARGNQDAGGSRQRTADHLAAIDGFAVTVVKAGVE
jgi:hypothetical protein